MIKRPLSVTIIACVFIAAGLIGLMYHFSDFTQRPLPSEVIWVAAVRVLAAVSGAFMLRGSNWARWLALFWLAFHVACSTLHSFREFAMHAAFLAVIAWFLLRPPVAHYFRAPPKRALA